MTSYLNSQTLPSPRPPVKDTDPLFENTLTSQYDLNSIIPVPKRLLETSLIHVEPLIPSIHGEQLAQELMKGHDTPDVFFYPFPYGRPYSTKRETYVYLEKQRRRTNLLHFAIVDKISGKLAGICALGCTPDQATLDLRIMSLKVFPEFRGAYTVYHAIYLLLSHALNPISEGGCGFVRCAWRNAEANPRSGRVAEKMGFTLEGPMRRVLPEIYLCYEVSDAYEGHPYEHFQTAVDGTGRLIEDATIYAMTHFDWLRDGKRQHLEAICSK